MPTLDWLDREQAMRRADEVPYRLLEHVSSHGDPTAGNLLIQGDNLEALKALLPFYRGRVKCIYIDPPYNTRSAFEHYDDNLEHSQWLSMVYPRVLLLRELLAFDGSIWVQLDDNEAHYAKVLFDEVIGRRNFVADITWQKSYAVRSNAEFFSTSTEHILVYSKERAAFSPNAMPRSTEQTARFSNPDNDPRGPWQSITFTISLVSGARGRQFAKTGQSDNIYEVTSPAGVTFRPPPGRCWARSRSAFEQLNADNRIWWGPKRDKAPRLKMFLREAKEGVIPTTLWADGEEYGFNQDGIRELRAMGLDFPTPKPETLISQVVAIGSDAGEIVLDSFLGSGTTAAVAHKMGRRYIGIEMGDHAVTHCLPRLEKVIAGEQGGISEVVDWKGGGGFQFLKLGDTVFNEAGAIHPKVRFATLANFIWLQETRLAASQRFRSPLLGTHNGTAYYLLFNGILGDKRPDGGNVLTGAVLGTINKKFPHRGPKIIYGESSRLGNARLDAAGVTFKHIPYDVRAR